MAKKQVFKAEVKQLLDLVIHSLYSNPDIFLRELIANAADAIDKARFAALTDSTQLREWKIELRCDKNAKTVTVSDNGIGMSADEVRDNIGTIAKSGTRAFLENLKSSGAANAPELIGQFGVGFYSAFMVADRVDLDTKRADAPAVSWSSDGESEYTVADSDRTEPGTSITLHLKANREAYLENWKLSEIVRRYSDFIEYPIVMPFVQVNEDKTETVEMRTLNSQKAIWLRPASEVTEEEHASFFSHLSHGGGGKPLEVIHMNAEGATEFKALLYLPEKMPFNMFMPELQKKGLQLYVRRVFITDNAEALVPDYLRFLRGVVDSSDLPLNVSRELLQENPLLGKIKTAITGKVLGELKKMLANDPEKYHRFFQEFGKILKEGIHTDVANQEKLKELALFETMNGEPGKRIGFREYIAAMPEGQEHIYYIVAESRRIAMASPALEIFRSKGYDVLLMTDPVDEFIMQSMGQFDKKFFRSADRGELEMEGDKPEDDKAVEEENQRFQGLRDALLALFKDQLSAVRFSRRLVDSACCLVSDENAMSSQMERLLKAMNQDVPGSKRILELNAKHPVIAAMQKLYEADPKSDTLKSYMELLLDQALLTEGSPLPDPLRFVRKVAALMAGDAPAAAQK